MDNIKEILNNKFIKPKKGQATAHQQLAVEIAESFNDTKHLGIYFKICKTFPEPYIRRIWGLVKEANPTNKGAYFTKLIFAQK